MARSITLGIVGDSAAGKTTLTRGLVRVLGEDNVTHVCVDDYHRYDRKQRAERNITPLHPECNHMDVMAQHLAHLRAGEPFLKPVYRHEDGSFGPLVRVDPKQFAVVDGLLGYYTEELRRLYVHPEFQNQGYGTALMDAALSHPGLNRAPSIFLDVWEHNHGAQRFYRRYGFEAIGTRTFEVESGTAASLDLVMVRRAAP